MPALVALAVLPLVPCFAPACFAPPCFAQDDSGRVISVALGPGQSLRDVARQHLGDPDLWPEILKASGLTNPAGIEPGRILRVPVGAVSAANGAITAALLRIQAANAAGAQLFAPDEIARAIDLQDAALQERVERHWTVARDVAARALEEATAALRSAEAKREEAAEALLSDRQGNVEGQRPRDISWNELRLRAILIEEQKVRTLSESTAQLTFRDASRLRLNANSNAIIQHMRFDALTRHEEAKVSLIEGDFYALLPKEGRAKTLEVEVPNVKASVQSGDFWVSSNRAAAKFTNYDDHPVAIAARGETLTLGRDEGAVVEAGRQPGAKRAVLAEPALTAPPDDGLVYGAAADLAWNRVGEAAGYWLEIAGDQIFERMVTSRFGLDKPVFRAEGLKPGSYFWRVAALDRFGLPGRRSAPFRFTVRIDVTPPFLGIDAPADKAITREAGLAVTGATEPGARVTIDDGPVPVGADGRFASRVALAAGANAVTIVSTDPAGNATRVVRTVTFLPDRAAGFGFV